MNKLCFAIVALIIATIMSLTRFVIQASASGTLDITLQVNWNDGSPVAGRLDIYNEDGSHCCSWTLDDTGWAQVQLAVSAGEKLEIEFTKDDGTVLYDAKTIPALTPDADMFLSLLNGKQVTVTFDPSDSSIEDVHLENQ